MTETLPPEPPSAAAHQAAQQEIIDNLKQQEDLVRKFQGETEKLKQ